MIIGNCFIDRNQSFHVSREDLEVQLMRFIIDVGLNLIYFVYVSF